MTTVHRHCAAVFTYVAVRSDSSGTLTCDAVTVHCHCAAVFTYVSVRSDSSGALTRDSVTVHCHRAAVFTYVTVHFTATAPVRPHVTLHTVTAPPHGCSGVTVHTWLFTVTVPPCSHVTEGHRPARSRRPGPPPPL